ncbi:MAG: non-homologous end-joining DNA ligase [Bacteriovoracaceae bacterium]
MKEEDFLPQLATLVDHPPEGGDWVHEAKFDGYRTLIFKTGDRVRFITRNGNDWTKAYAELASEVKKFPFKSLVLDGEIVALNAQGIPDFNKLQNALGRFKPKLGVRGLVFYAFDLLYLDGKDFRGKNLLERKNKLEEVMKKIKAKDFRYSEHFETDDPQALYQKMCHLGLEGIISKNIHATYSGTRSKYWLKTKCGQSDEFIIIGYRTGTNHPIGSLLLGSLHNGKLRYEGKVGTGFSQKTKEELARAFKGLETKTPTVNEELKYKNIVWLKPKLIAEVNFLGKTNEGLRHSSFMRLRPDKETAEVTRDEFDRELLRAYYKKVSPLLLPELKERPLNLYICHGGPNGRCYYLRRSESRSMKNVKTTLKPNGHFLMSFSTAAGIQSCVDLGTIEFHLWGTTIPHLETPDRMIFDLDAGEGVPLSAIHDCAEQLRERLLEIDLESFVMTSGGKGYHIHVPIAPLYSWDEVKGVALTIARSLEEDHPSLYTTSMSPAKRKKKIFIDFLRNTRGHTAIAPYSVRAKERATLAVPVSWKELRKTSPDEFTMADAEKILRRKDPWAGIRKLKQKISLLE